MTNSLGCVSIPAFKNTAVCGRASWRPSRCVANLLDWTVIEPARPIALRRREYLNESELCADGSRESDDVEKLENSG